MTSNFYIPTADSLPQYTFPLDYPPTLGPDFIKTIFLIISTSSDSGTVTEGLCSLPARTLLFPE